MSRRILNVAEKHDVAKIISGILSGNKSNRTMIVDDKYKFWKYEFQCALNENIQSSMIFTHVAGHLYSLEFPESCNNWNSIPYERLFTEVVNNEPSKVFIKIIRQLKSLAKECELLIIWTDCDREGENIGFEIIDTCKMVNKKIQVARAKFSDLNESSIWYACRNLVSPNEAMSNAVDARKELDLRIGATYTRMQSIYLKSNIPSLNQLTCISYGPCQFPTLGFVVERYEDIQNFKSETFWKISVKHKRSDIDNNFLWSRNHLFDKDAVKALHEFCIENNIATVTNVVKKIKTKYRPQPLYTIEFEKLASKYLKMTAKNAMSIAENLYSRGFISYPRTETNMFSSSTNLYDLVKLHSSDANLSNFVNKVLENGPRPRNGDKTDNSHPPIHPIKYTNQLSGDEKKVYDLIVRHFLATCSFDGKGDETKVTIQISSETFVATGLIIKDKGYLEVYPFDKWDSQMLGEYIQNEQFTPDNILINEGNTSPPSLLTEADLISLMEKYGIGTDATQAEHIDTIKRRDYVSVVNGRFIPTSLGMGLIKGYQNMGFDKDEYDLGKPFLRAELESSLINIINGQVEKQVVINSFVDKYRNIFNQINLKKEILKNTVEKYISENPIIPPTTRQASRPSSGTSRKNSQPKASTTKKSTQTKSRTTRKNTDNSSTKTLPKTNTKQNNKINCFCKKAALLLTAKNGANAGRQFYVCSNTTNKCKFFKWHTPVPVTSE